MKPALYQRQMYGPNLAWGARGAGSMHTPAAFDKPQVPRGQISSRPEVVTLNLPVSTGRGLNRSGLFLHSAPVGKLLIPEDFGGSIPPADANLCRFFTSSGSSQALRIKAALPHPKVEPPHHLKRLSCVSVALDTQPSQRIVGSAQKSVGVLQNVAR